MTKIEELRSKISAAKEQLKKEVQAFFNAEVKQLFEKHSDLEQVRWTQYTPYFNDGDVCTFRSNHYYASINSDNPWEYEDDEEHKQPSKDTSKAVHAFLNQFTDDDMEEMFGDHAEIVVTKNGVEVLEYSHD